MSGINVDDVDHSSYLARLTLDKQQTAVLSSSVGKVISLQRLDCLILKPNFFCVSGNSLLDVSTKCKYGSPVSCLVSKINLYSSLAFIDLDTFFECGSISFQSIFLVTAVINSSVILIP